MQWGGGVGGEKHGKQRMGDICWKGSSLDRMPEGEGRGRVGEEEQVTGVIKTVGREFGVGGCGCGLKGYLEVKGGWGGDEVRCKGAIILSRPGKLQEQNQESSYDIFCHWLWIKHESFIPMMEVDLININSLRLHQIWFSTWEKWIRHVLIRPIWFFTGLRATSGPLKVPVRPAWLEIQTQMKRYLWHVFLLFWKGAVILTYGRMRVCVCVCQQQPSYTARVSHATPRKH